MYLTLWRYCRRMTRNIQLFICRVTAAIASRRWKCLEKITVSKNKLCNIFAVNDTTELSEIRLLRQSWLYNSVTVISCWTDIFLHNNYCNIDAISRHMATAGLLCVCVFFLFHIFFILCTYLYICCVSSIVKSVNKDYEIYCVTYRLVINKFLHG